ncbi:hypothetical protein QBC46DRAFT_377874 [Diplogelasinospora grovesii]|uniref:cellulase n=1 Tax=Diplogelasinospora grovesii TaxID=303347 RepID=A0AAN6S6S6_9PEZI|nr:hypothetical protein QBC46DRAFT_377874 [Diplogelasinospora grovesii]
MASNNVALDARSGCGSGELHLCLYVPCTYSKLLQLLTEVRRNRGNQNGGVDSSNSCASLPQNLPGGCYWRFNWAKGDINGWNAN